jgi:hypothetical protein
LQLAEHTRALTLAIAENAGNRDLGVVIEDRLRHAVEERERSYVPVAERFRRLCWVATTKIASECGRSIAKKWILRSTPPITPIASPKSAWACPGGCTSGTNISCVRWRQPAT